MSEALKNPKQIRDRPYKPNIKHEVNPSSGRLTMSIYYGSQRTYESELINYDVNFNEGSIVDHPLVIKEKEVVKNCLKYLSLNWNYYVPNQMKLAISLLRMPLDKILDFNALIEISSKLQEYKEKRRVKAGSRSKSYELNKDELQVLDELQNIIHLEKIMQDIGEHGIASNYVKSSDKILSVAFLNFGIDEHKHPKLFDVLDDLINFKEYVIDTLTAFKRHCDISDLEFNLITWISNQELRKKFKKFCSSFYNDNPQTQKDRVYCVLSHLPRAVINLRLHAIIGLNKESILKVFPSWPKNFVDPMLFWMLEKKEEKSFPFS